MKKLAAIVAAVSIIAFAALAYGDMGAHGMESGMMYGCGMDRQMMEFDHHISKHLMGLNLSEQQKTLIGEIKSRMMKETIRRTADMRIVEIELKEILSEDPLDMKAVEAKVKQLEMIKTDIYLSHVQAMENIKARLAPEQRTKLREMIEAGPVMEGMEMKHDQESCEKGK